MESESDKAILVGHSIGGIACRLYLGGEPPFGGRRYSGHRRVRRLITLGTPHLTVEGKSLNLINRVNKLFP
ncbi:MAG: esterase, partial [Actinomycetota bacterium]|nr:esterase [Actinomycetota bacterium]